MNTIIHIIEQLKLNQMMLEITCIYIDSSKKFNDKDPKLKVCDHVRISKYRNIFGKGYTPNWSEEVFIIKEVKNTIPWTCY